jgi:hypothetical protein
MTDKQFTALLKKHGAAELAESYIFPVKLNKAEKAKADKDLSESIAKRRSALTEEDRLKGRLLQLRLQIQDYLNSAEFDKRRTFAFFLTSYIQSLNIRQSQLAREIAIKPAVLSQYLNGYRTPSDVVIIRLELHSGNMIPALSWYCLLEKEHLHTIAFSKLLRNEQKRFVRKSMPA